MSPLYQIGLNPRPPRRPAPQHLVPAAKPVPHVVPRPKPQAAQALPVRRPRPLPAHPHIPHLVPQPRPLPHLVHCQQSQASQQFPASQRNPPQPRQFRRIPQPQHLQPELQHPAPQPVRQFRRFLPKVQAAQRFPVNPHFQLLPPRNPQQNQPLVAHPKPQAAQALPASQAPVRQFRRILRNHQLIQQFQLFPAHRPKVPHPRPRPRPLKGHFIPQLAQMIGFIMPLILIILIQLMISDVTVGGHGSGHGAVYLKMLQSPKVPQSIQLR